MYCQLKYKESKSNALEDLKKAGIISDVRKLDTDRQKEFKSFEQMMIAFFEESYGVKVNKLFEEKEITTNLRDGRGGKSYYVEPIEEAFAKVDYARKKLGIFESQKSYAEYKYGAEVNTPDVYTEGKREYVVTVPGLYNEETGLPLPLDKQSLWSANYQRIGAENVTIEMAKAVKTIVDGDSLLELDGTGKSYTFLKNGDVFRRVSDYIHDFGELYIYKGNQEDYTINAEYGNQIDYVFRHLLESDGDTVKVALIDDAEKRGQQMLLSDEVLENIVNYVEQFLEENKDKVILTQVGFYNEKLKVAGKADIVTIDKEGKIKIYDVKSSIANTAPDRDGNTSYTKNFYDSTTREMIGASKKQRHIAQLSLYYGMAQSKGLEFEEDALEIIPIYISEVDTDGFILNAEKEPNIPLGVNPKIVNKVNIDLDTSLNYSLNSESLQQVMEKVKIAVQTKINFYKADPKKAKSVKYLSNLLRKLSEDTELKSIDLFVEDTYKALLDPKYGIEKRLADLENNLDVLGAGETMYQLGALKDELQVYDNILKELVEVYSKNKIRDVEFDKESTLAKLSELHGKSMGLLSLATDRVIPLIGKALYKETGDKASTLKSKEEAYLQKRYDAYMAAGQDAKALYIGKILEKYKENQSLSEQELINELEKGSNKDIPFVDYLLSPAISSSNTVVSAFAKQLKTVLENIRQKSRSYLVDNYHIFEEYQKYKGISGDNPAIFNEDFYQIVTYNTKQGEEYKKIEFIQPIDYNKFNESKQLFYNQNESLKKNNPKEFKELEKRWYAENTTLINNKDTVVELEGKKIVLEKGISSILEETKESMSSTDYENWLDSVTTINSEGDTVYTDKQFYKPNSKYESTKYKKLNAESKKYYNFLIATHFKAQERYSTKLGYEIPQISKSNYDRIREGSVADYVKYHYKGLTNFTSEDSNAGNITGDKIVPEFFTSKIPIEDLSLDLFSSVIRFNEGSLRFQELSKFAHYANTTLDIVKKNTPVETDSMGRQLVDTAAKSLGIKSWQAYKKKNVSNQAALLEAFIDMQVYGQNKKVEKTSIFSKEVNLGKWADTLIAFGSHVALPFNFLQGVANSLQANIQVQIEATAGEYFKNSEFFKAEGIYDSAITDLLKDFGQPYAKSKLGQLLELYDAFQGEYRDNYGRRVSHTVAKKLWSTDRIFFLQNAGEHHIQAKTLIAFLLSNKITSDKGVQTTLWDAYEEKDGKIKLKEGFKIEGYKTDNGLVNISIQNKIHALNKRFHGVYNSFDQSVIQQYGLGRLVMNFRKFITPGFKKRFKAFGYDNELEDFTEGTYKTFIRLAINESQELLKYVTFQENNLSPLEKANLTRTLAEFGWMLSMIVISSILMSAYKDEDDEDKKLVLSYPLYWSMRLGSELRFFALSPPDLMRIIRYPIPAQNTVENGLKLFGQMFDYDEKYKRKTGVHDKGDYKLPAATLKFLGYSGNSFNPENSVKQMEQSALMFNNEEE